MVYIHIHIYLIKISEEKKTLVIIKSHICPMHDVRKLLEGELIDHSECVLWIVILHHH